ncbi:MAG: hypothetical protein ACKVP3_23030, partial [Hyphomicrobiaceae bacterium]
THARRGVLRTPEHAADPLGGLTPADDPLTQAECLSEQTGPPHAMLFIAAVAAVVLTFGGGTVCDCMLLDTLLPTKSGRCASWARDMLLVTLFGFGFALALFLNFNWRVSRRHSFIADMFVLGVFIAFGMSLVLVAYSDNLQFLGKLKFFVALLAGLSTAVFGGVALDLVVCVLLLAGLLFSVGNAKRRSRLLRYFVSIVKNRVAYIAQSIGITIVAGLFYFFWDAMLPQHTWEALFVTTAVYSVYVGIKTETARLKFRWV